MIYENRGGYWFKSTDAFEDDIRAARENYKRLDQVWRGLRHHLAHSPGDGWKSRSHHDVHIMETEWSGDPEAPAIAVVYKFDDTTVYLLRLQAKVLKDMDADQNEG